MSLCRIDKIVTVSSNCPTANTTMTTTASNFTTTLFANLTTSMSMLPTSSVPGSATSTSNPTS